MSNNDFSDWIEGPIEVLKNLKATIQSYRHIYIWVGFDVSERLQLGRLLKLISGMEVKLFRPDFPNIAFKNSRDETYYSKTVSLTAVNNIKIIFDSFIPIEHSDYPFYIDLWQKMLEENGDIRIFDSENNMCSKPIDFYNQFLLEYCEPEFKTSSRVVGYTLAYIYSGHYNFHSSIGNIFMYWRLRQLVLQGKLESVDHSGGDPARWNGFDVSLKG